MSNGMFWFKVWNELAQDYKFDVLAQCIRKNRWELLGYWIRILTWASQSPERGTLLITNSMRITNSDFELEFSINEEEAEAFIDTLIKLEMLLKNEDGDLVVINWKKRQDPIDPTGAKRWRDWKEKHAPNNEQEDTNALANALVERLEPVSKRVEDRGQRTEDRGQKKEEKRKESAAAANIFNLYHDEIGTLTKTISDQLMEAEKEYPAEWFEVAFQEAARHNARSWSYVEAILKRWKTDGFKSSKGRKGKSEIDPTLQSLIDDALIHDEPEERSNGRKGWRDPIIETAFSSQDLPEQSLDALKDCTIQGFDTGILTISALSDSLDWLTKRMSKPLQRQLSWKYPGITEIRFVEELA